MTCYREQMVRRVGDRLIVTKKFAGRDRITGIPEDVVGRVGTVIDVDGPRIRLQYPNGIKMPDGSAADSVVVDERDTNHGLEKVRLITDGYESGPHRGSVMLDVADVYNGFWGRFSNNDPRRSHHGHLERIQDSIEREGMRHPIVLNRKMELRTGAYRLAAYKRLGREKIEAYITDTDAKRSWRL